MSSCNLLGCSAPCSSFPLQLAPPKQKPSKPSKVSLTVMSQQSLRVFFSRPECDGGDPVTAYKIEWDTASTFKSSRGFPAGTHNYIVSTLDEGCKHCSIKFALEALPTIGSIIVHTSRMKTGRIFFNNLSHELW